MLNTGTTILVHFQISIARDTTLGGVLGLSELTAYRFPSTCSLSNILLALFLEGKIFLCIVVKPYSWELVSNFITNNTAKIQLKILGRTFRLTSGAIVNAKKLTLRWVLSHDTKMK